MVFIYYYSNGVHIVCDGAVQEWLPRLNKKDNINKDFMPEVEKCFFELKKKKVEMAPVFVEWL